MLSGCHLHFHLSPSAKLVHWASLSGCTIHPMVLEVPLMYCTVTNVKVSFVRYAWCSLSKGPSAFPELLFNNIYDLTLDQFYRNFFLKNSTQVHSTACHTYHKK